MARKPTIAEEDAKLPNREREWLVGERTRIINRMKGTPVRLGIRNFKPTLRKLGMASGGFGDANIWQRPSLPFRQTVEISREDL